LNGTILSIVLNQSIVLLITLFFIRSENWFVKSNFDSCYGSVEMKLLLGFASVSILSTALSPISSMIIRNFLIKEASLFEAGLYDFVLRICSSVILFFTLTLSTYYIPRISEISERNELVLEIKKTYIVVLPLVFFLLLFVYIFREHIILLLATKEFLRSSDLFVYSMIGVFFKVCAQIVGFVFLSKAMIKHVMIVEIIYNIGFTLLSVLFIRLFGLFGSVLSFFLSNLIYFAAVIILFYYNFITDESNLC
jgi:PST family polysaccharide transporter